MQNQIISAWKDLAKNKKITARNTLTYILLRADGPTEALYHIRRAFSTIKNPVKLANGRKSFDCLTTSTNYILGASLSQWASSAATERDIRSRFAEFGIEPTDEQVKIFQANYAYCCKQLGL